MTRSAPRFFLSMIVSGLLGGEAAPWIKGIGSAG